MSHKIITYCFFALFIITPLLFTPFNYELFEYNKMMLVYLLTVLIAGAWIFQMIRDKKLLIKKTPLDIPLLIFLASQILSTVFSIDPHTSIWGYYSRSNGGLLSVISYTILYYALVSQFTPTQILKFLRAALFSAVAVSLYAIPEHFGVSPSCVVLVNRFAADCWVQDVQARVFATLGQPNWLAAYLGMMIFPTIYFFLNAKTFISRITYYLSLIALYAAFTFTFSRGATLGLLTGLMIFIPLLLLKSGLKLAYKNIQIRSLSLVIISFLIINLFYGSALTRFKLVTPAQPPPKPAGQSTPTVTQLEAGGTESGQIRLIVWKGALEIFKHYPIFGSGVETFAYSYYNFRPAEHNLVSEWDFLYNKAHNEYLNYLATTGLLGFLSYLALIVTYLAWSIKQLAIRIKDKKLDSTSLFPVAGLLAGYISYLVQNFFGFSVVIIALLFYLFPAMAFVLSESNKELELPKNIAKTFANILSLTIYKRPLYTKLALTIVTITLTYLGFTLYQYWRADTMYKKGSDYADIGNPGRAYNELVKAAAINRNEPLYKNELGFAAGSAAVALAEDDATTSAMLKEESITQTQKSLDLSPKNISLWRTAIRSYYQLSALDPQFVQKTLEVMDKTIELAPTDAKLFYNKGLVLGQEERYEEGINALKKAVELRPNYWEAYFTLGVFYQTLDQKDPAKQQFETVLKLIPNHPETMEKLEELK